MRSACDAIASNSRVVERRLDACAILIICSFKVLSNPCFRKGRRIKYHFDTPYLLHKLHCCNISEVRKGHPFGAMAQLVAHLHGMERVRGSNPLSSTGKVFGFSENLFHFQTVDVSTFQGNNTHSTRVVQHLSMIPKSSPIHIICTGTLAPIIRDVIPGW